MTCLDCPTPRLPESENKYEALARKLQTQETEGVKSNERAENVEVCSEDCRVFDRENRSW